MELLLGIDDTDVLGHKPGTGRLARELGAHLAREGLAELLGVVRQQLLVDPRIPYTSHNSPACLMLRARAACSDGGARLLAAATAYVVERAAVGSDPGVCLAERAAVGPEVEQFGARCAGSVVRKAEALDLAARSGLRLEELGGTGGGVIGALAAVGLTAGGDAGRFLDYAGGLRDVSGQITAAELRERGIGVSCLGRNADWVPARACIDVGDRLRPRLIGGRAVLLVEPTETGWRSFDRRDPRPEDGPGSER